MKVLYDLWKIFFLNSKIGIQRNMQYRFDFINGLMMSLLNSSIGVIIILMIFVTTNGYPGWTLTQILLFQGISLFGSGLRDLLFGSVRTNVDFMVREGTFDRLLLKPYPPIGLILTGGPNYMSLSGTLAGLIFILYALGELKLHLTPLNLGYFLLFMIGAIVLYMTFLVLYCCILIMTVVVGRLSEIMDKILGFSEYPLDIYGKTTAWFFRYVFPLAIFIYLPTKALLGHLDYISLISIPICFLLFILSLLLWQHCLNKYTSAGG